MIQIYKYMIYKYMCDIDIYIYMCFYINTTYIFIYHTYICIYITYFKDICIYIYTKNHIFQNIYT